MNARRRPQARRVGVDEGDDDEAGDEAQRPAQPSHGKSVLRRVSRAHTEAAAFRPRARPRPTQSRLSFQAEPEEADEPAATVVPRRSHMSRTLADREAQRLAARAAQRLADARHASDDDDAAAPAYTPELLSELRAATAAAPPGPRPESPEPGLAVYDLPDDAHAVTLAYDIKGGAASAPAMHDPGLAKGIREHRQRLARESRAGDYVSLAPDLRDEDGAAGDDDGGGDDDDDDDDDDTRLEEYVDSKLVLGRDMRATERRARRRAVEDALEHAGDGDVSDADSVDSAWQRAQIRKGDYGGRQRAPGAQRPRAPRVIPPVPTLEGALARLQHLLAELTTQRARVQEQLAGLEADSQEIVAQELGLQDAIRAAEARYHRVVAEHGHDAVQAPRGLESLGTG